MVLIVQIVYVPGEKREHAVYGAHGHGRAYGALDTNCPGSRAAHDDEHAGIEKLQALPEYFPVNCEYGVAVLVQGGQAYGPEGVRAPGHGKIGDKLRELLAARLVGLAAQVVPKAIIGPGHLARPCARKKFLPALGPGCDKF